MKLRTRLSAAVLGGAIVLTGGAASIAPANAAPAHHPCTRTSSGSCIRGGEFCKQSQYGHSGWDAKGRRYVCKGNHEHPHWEIP